MIVSRANATTCSWYQQMIDTINRSLCETSDYRIEEDRFYRHQLDFKNTAPDEEWKAYVPRDERPTLLQCYHDAPTGI